jgi:hypothetical protein
MEPSGPAKTCNGIALPLPYSFLLEAVSTPGAIVRSEELCQ